jgi:hypothetical protein
MEVVAVAGGAGERIAVACGNGQIERAGVGAHAVTGDTAPGLPVIGSGGLPNEADYRRQQPVEGEGFR